MKLRAAFLAQEAAQNQDGTFMVWRGGITNFNATAFPALIRTVLILRLEADALEARTLHSLRLRVVHEDHEGSWQESPIAFMEVTPPETAAYLNMLVNLNFGVRQPGAGRIELGLVGLVGIPALNFQVDQAPLPPGFSPV